MALETLGVRALVSLIFGPVILLAAWFGGLFFAVFVAAVSSLALWEFYQMGLKKNVFPQQFWGVLAGLLWIFFLYRDRPQFLFYLLVALLLLCMATELFRNKPNPLLNLGVTLLGFFYVSFLMSFLLLLRELPSQAGMPYVIGGKVVILLFLSIWICDSAAYILGSRLGKHKLFPRVSPNKTVEGTLFGFLFAILTAYVCQLTFLREVALRHVLAIGAICGSVGQMSDLVESLLKRDAGVKDSSNLIPGHGGVLDRFDSEILTVPVVFAYLKLVAF